MLKSENHPVTLKHAPQIQHMTLFARVFRALMGQQSVSVFPRPVFPNAHADGVQFRLLFNVMFSGALGEISLSTLTLNVWQREPNERPVNEAQRDGGQDRALPAERFAVHTDGTEAQIPRRQGHEVEAMIESRKEEPIPKEVFHSPLKPTSGGSFFRKIGA